MTKATYTCGFQCDHPIYFELKNLVKNNIIQPLHKLNSIITIEINYFIDNSIIAMPIVKHIQNTLALWSQAFYNIGINIEFIHEYNQAKHNLIFKSDLSIPNNQLIYSSKNNNDIIMRFNPLFDWLDSSIPDLMLFNMISHQLGHIFGLNHDTDTKSIMFPHLNKDECDLEKHINIETLAKTYDDL